MASQEKALWGELPFFIASVFIVLILIFFMSDIISSYIKESQLRAEDVDITTSFSFQNIYNDIVKISPTDSSLQLIYQLKGSFSIHYLNPNDASDLIKNICSRKSCLCLCKDSLCTDIVECRIVNNKFKESGKIINKGELIIKYTKDGISIEPKQ